MPDLDTLIDDLEQGYQEQTSESGQQKTASHGEPNIEDIENDLNGLLQQDFQGNAHNARGGQGTEKTASNETGNDQTVEQGIDKIASELAEADMAATKAEAELFGSAMFDSFLKEANKYASHAAQAQTQAQQKTASAQRRQKVAAAEVQRAKQAGYQDAQSMLSGGRQKTASAEVQRAKQAGYQDAQSMLSGGRQKTASAEVQRAKQAGYQDAQSLMNGGRQKEASDEIQRAKQAGYRDAQSLFSGGQEKNAAQERERGKIAALRDVATAATKCFNQGTEDIKAILNQG